MELVLASLVVGIVMGVLIMGIAGSKGYEQSFGWFFYGFMIWPIALIHSLLLEPKKNPQEGNKQKTSRRESAKTEEDSIIILPESHVFSRRKERGELEILEKKAELERIEKLELEEKKVVKIILISIVFVAAISTLVIVLRL